MMKPFAVMMNGGYIERKANGTREGVLAIDGVDLSPIEGMYFEKKENKENWLWLKRKPLLEYDSQTLKFNQRQKEPRWETYLKKTSGEGKVAYQGRFVFLRFVYEITGIWDAVLGKDKERLNLYIERLPMSEQSFINNSRSL